VQALGGAAEVQLLGDGDEIAEVAELHVAVMMVAVDEFHPREGMIRLGQLLKAAGLADTGGEAKALLAEGVVTVNGVLETRRGRQLAPGDVVTVGDASVRVT
jgi:ribosome-associated protein